MTQLELPGPLPEYRVGQIWQDRQRKPDSVFLITHIYERVYAAGNRVLRVVGIPSHKESYSHDHLDPRPVGSPTPELPTHVLRDLDARSMEQMYTHKIWEPLVPRPAENK